MAQIVSNHWTSKKSTTFLLVSCAAHSNQPCTLGNAWSYSSSQGSEEKEENCEEGEGVRAQFPTIPYFPHLCILPQSEAGAPRGSNLLHFNGESRFVILQAQKQAQRGCVYLSPSVLLLEQCGPT